MKIGDLTSHLSQFYRSLHLIAGRYGRLSQTVARYFHRPLLKQARGLPLNTQTTQESYVNRSILGQPRGWENTSPILSPNEVANLPSATHAFPAISSWLPELLQKSPILKTAAFLPSSAKFNMNQGRFIPFASPVRSRAQESNSGPQQVQIDQAAGVTRSPSRSATSLESGRVAPGTPAEQSTQQNQVSITSTARQFLRVAASFPLVPVALAQSTKMSSPLGTQVFPSYPSSTNLPGQKQAPTIGTVGAQDAPSALTSRVFSLQRHAISTGPTPVAILRNQSLQTPLLGLNRAVTSQAFPDLGRASRLDSSTSPLPPTSSQGVHTSSLATGPSRNLSRVITAYAENEASQARLHLTSKTVPSAIPTTQLPKLQSINHQTPTYASANHRLPGSSELPALGAFDTSTHPSFGSQPETLPRLSEWERRNFELDESEDQVSMEELRTKISKILSEELRRYLPGE